VQLVAHSVPRSPLRDQCERDGGLHDRVRLAVAARAHARLRPGADLQHTLRDGRAGALNELLLTRPFHTHLDGEVAEVHRLPRRRRDLLIGQRSVQEHPGEHLVADADGVDGAVVVGAQHMNFVVVAVALLALGVDEPLHAPHCH